MSNSPTTSTQSQDLSDQLEGFLGPLLQWLDAQVDKRLVRTFLLTLQAILMLRHTNCSSGGRKKWRIMSLCCISLAPG